MLMLLTDGFALNALVWTEQGIVRLAQ